MGGPRREGQPVKFEIPSQKPEINWTYDFDDLVNRMRAVKLLNDSIKDLHPYLSSQITLEEVNISDIKPCALYVLNQNLEIQRKLRKELLSQGIDTLHLTHDKALINYSWGGIEHVLTPPIIEVSEDDGFANIITDGLHRVTVGKEEGQSTITAAVIRNTAVPLSVLPVGWDSVRRLDSVPPTNEKRRMRFSPSEEMFRWFGLNERNMERLIGGFVNLQDYSYKAFFRALDFDKDSKSTKTYSVDESPREFGIDSYGKPKEFIKSKEECLREYSSAGFLIISEDSQHVLLGSHHEAPNLWGNFAGGRMLGEIDPRVTARRELEEELGIKLDPKLDLGEPLIVIANHKGRKNPGIGIIYHLKINKEARINIPQDSEIKELKWTDWSGTTALMDEADPTERLWGGVYTATAFQVFDSLRYGHDFGGMHQIDSWWYGVTPYERLKDQECKNRLVSAGN